MSIFLRFEIPSFGRAGDNVHLVERYKAHNLQSAFLDEGGEVQPVKYVYIVRNNNGEELALDRWQVLVGRKAERLYLVRLDLIPKTEYYDFYFAREEMGPIYSSCPDGVPTRCLVTGEEMSIPINCISRWKPRDRCDSTDGRWVPVVGSRRFDTPIPAYLLKSKRSNRFREFV